MGKKVSILVFSTRPNGNCSHIGEFISNYHAQDQVTIFGINARDFAPCGGCNYECLNPSAVCPLRNQQQDAVMDAICASDLVYYIVPNYCGYPNANYFAFNERSVGYFNLDRALIGTYMSVPKAFIIVSNTEGFESAMRQQTKDEPRMIYLKSGKYKKRSTAGDILDSEEAQQDLTAFLQSL